MIVDGGTLVTFGVVATRFSGVALMAPVLSGQQVPMKVRLGLVVAVSAVLVPSVERYARPSDDFMNLPGMLAVELLLGLMMGVSFRWSMEAAKLAGEMSGLQMGMGVASTIDPSTGNNALFGQMIFGLLYAVIFLALDGHHMVLRTFQHSYELAPAGGPFTTGFAPDLLLHQTGGIFVAGLQLAAGFLIPLMMVTFAMALVSRAFPQANVFVLSYAASLLLGLTLYATAAPAMRRVVDTGIEDGARNALRLVQTLSGA